MVLQISEDSCLQFCKIRILDGPTSGFPLNLLPLKFHILGFLVYHRYNARKTIQKRCKFIAISFVIKAKYWPNWFSLLLTWICSKGKSNFSIVQLFFFELFNRNPQGGHTIIIMHVVKNSVLSHLNCTVGSVWYFLNCMDCICIMTRGGIYD